MIFNKRATIYLALIIGFYGPKEHLNDKNNRYNTQV